MATHSSILAWKTPRMEVPGGLPSMESQSWTRLSDFTFQREEEWKGKVVQKLDKLVIN